MPSLFSLLDPSYHKDLNVFPRGSTFLQTKMKKIEIEFTGIFLQTTRELEQQARDLAAWLQW